MIYADYGYYTNDYLVGKQAVIDTASFPFYARQASVQIDSATFNKSEKAYLESSSEASIRATLGCCCCELAELMYKNSLTATEKGISSETVKGYSVSYSQQSQVDYTIKINAVIRKWLTNTGLLYCGVIV